MEVRSAGYKIRAGMQYKLAMAGTLLLVLGLSGRSVHGRTYEGTRAEADRTRRRWLGRDVHLATGLVVSQKIAPGQLLLVCQEGFSMTVAGREFTSERGVVWITTGQVGDEGDVAGREVQAYLRGDVDASRPSEVHDAGLMDVVLEQGRAMVVKSIIDGEVFMTADANVTASPGSLPLYREAVAAFAKAGLNSPTVPDALLSPGTSPGVDKADREKPRTGYTVSIAYPTDVVPKWELTKSESGEETITIIGRIDISWLETNAGTAQSELVEMQADSIVLWRTAADTTQQQGGLSATQQEGVSQIYVSGDVFLRQGQRTIRADELYYDLEHQRALATNVVLRTFDVTRNVPIYVRAGQLRQIAANHFEAEDVILTTSEFWTPQISLQAARVWITDRTEEVKPDGALSESSFDVQLKDVKLKYGNMTVLLLPSLRSDRQRPDVPIRSISMGHDRTYGTSVETRWFLSRILGLREPEGTDSTLSLDYYGKRGLGGGVEIDYERENYFGSLLGYVIDDTGEDRLGRTRKNIDVPEETRGRLRFQHRHYLPYDWQLTAEASYLSDENFLEQYYRGEFNLGKEQETLLYLKRIQDNWGLSFLGKTRLNDFMDQVEELPSAEYHLTGQSLLDDRFTFFSDNQVSRYRYRFSPGNPLDEPDEFFTFTATRNELDMPLALGRSKIVPFVAGTFGYEDGAGFQAPLDDAPVESKDAILVGEAGVRMSMQPFWCVYPDVESRLLDLHGLRHVIRPGITAVAYAASDTLAEQRDTLDLEISQRWQTRRGPAGRQRTVDWLKLDVDFVWLSDSSDATAGPDRLIWNAPLIPLANRIGNVIPPVDRRTTDMFGPRQNYIGTEMILRLTDTTAVLSDLYIDMQSGVVEQFNVGFSRLVWPNLSYYLGSRYLRNVSNGLGEKGSHALTFAATYVLDPRYTAVLSQQYDTDYGANIRTDVTVIRRYHRMNLALTFSLDESLDEQRVVLSLWPEGIPELAIGLRRYMALGASDVYY